MGKKAKQPKNLSLDPDAIERADRYAAKHQTNLSRLVSDFLRSLPLTGPGRDLAPAVRRLYGVAAGRKASRDTYRAHLLEKYGRSS